MLPLVNAACVAAAWLSHSSTKSLNRSSRGVVVAVSAAGEQPGADEKMQSLATACVITRVRPVGNRGVLKPYVKAPAVKRRGDRRTWMAPKKAGQPRAGPHQKRITKNHPQGRVVARVGIGGGLGWTIHD